ncbi:MAG TPA: DUF177 domain-containing protein [Gemmatimonadales bacterium]|nr:DUF177 domain-containing protein [Gemmatimonadales bacterium]
MLRVDLRELRHGPVEVRADVAAGDAMFEGLDLDLVEPVEVDGLVQAADSGEYLFRAQVGTRARFACRRCLTDVEHDIELDLNVLFSSDPDAADDPSIYPLPVNPTHLDLGSVLREELALAVSPFVLCREDCAGLCPECGADLNAGPCNCAVAAETN